MKTKAKITRKDTREHLAQLHLACELVKVIHHYFPGLLFLLKDWRILATTDISLTRAMSY